MELPVAVVVLPAFGRESIRILSRFGVLRDPFLYQPGDHGEFVFQPAELGVKILAIRISVHNEPAVPDQLVLAPDEGVERRDKGVPDILLFQMGRGAAVLAFIFAVALPYRPAVFIGRVPYLGAEELAAVSTDKPGGEDAVPAVFMA